MSIEHHLIIHEVTLRPAGEWSPPALGWTVVRVADGLGYWLQGGGAQELNEGDGFVVTEISHLVLRASQLGPLKLQFYCVQPQFLNGLITVAEGRQLEQAGKSSSARVIVFRAADPAGQKFSRLVARPARENLTMRSALLQLWSQAVSGVLLPRPVEVSGHKLRERFRELVAQMPDAELAKRSLPELAEQLHCSERHFSRLFRAEIGVPLRKRQTELRLQRAPVAGGRQCQDRQRRLRKRLPASGTFQRHVQKKVRPHPKRMAAAESSRSPGLFSQRPVRALSLMRLVRLRPGRLLVGQR